MLEQGAIHLHTALRNLYSLGTLPLLLYAGATPRGHRPPRIGQQPCFDNLKARRLPDYCTARSRLRPCHALISPPAMSCFDKAAIHLHTALRNLYSLYSLPNFLHASVTPYDY